MPQRFLSLAAIAGFLAVALGAFGAHGLQGRLDEAAMAVYRTAALYHMWHAIALCWIGMLLQRYPDDRRLTWAGRLFLAGLFLFSGSLYLLSLTGWHWLGLLTPLGGLAFLAGWALAALALWQWES